MLISQNTAQDSFPEESNELDKIADSVISIAEHEHLVPEALLAPSDQEITQDQLSLSKKLLNWRTVVPLIVVIGLLIFTVQKSGIDPQKTWSAMRSANILFLLAGFFIYYLSFPIRTTRWRMLLQNVGYTPENNVRLPGFFKLMEILYISWFANVVVPAKLGDLYRAYLLKHETNVSTSRSFGTVIAERLLDLIVLLLLFISAILIGLREQLPPQLQFTTEVLFVLVIVGIAGLFGMRIFHDQISRLIPVRFRNLYIHFQEGTLGSFRRLPTLTGLTVLTWACESLRFFCVAMALNLIPGDPIHVIAAGFVIGLGEALLTAIPATGGGLGVVEIGMIGLIGIIIGHNPATNNLMGAAIILDRLISFWSVLVFGFLVFVTAFGRQAATQKPQKS